MLTAQTTFSDFLTFDGPQHLTIPVFQGGGEDKLQDDNLAKLLDNDQSNSITDGDQLVTMIKISDVNSSNRLNVGVHGRLIVFVTAYEFQNGSMVASPGLLTDLLDPSVAVGIDNNSVGVVLSSNPSNLGPGPNPLNWSPADITTGFVAPLWNWEMTLGQEFAEMQGDPFVLGGTVRGGMTIQSTAFGNNGWIGVDVYDSSGNIFIVDMSLDTGSYNVASQDEQNRGWNFRGQASFFVNPAELK